MRKTFLLTTLALLSLLVTRSAEPDKQIPAKETGQHVGETVSVTGKVTGVRTLDSGMTLVNLGGPYPDQACTIVVRPQHAKAVGDISGFDGKTITVRGTITAYKGKPQIEISKRDVVTEVKN